MRSAWRDLAVFCSPASGTGNRHNIAVGLVSIVQHAVMRRSAGARQRRLAAGCRRIFAEAASGSELPPELHSRVDHMREAIWPVLARGECGAFSSQAEHLAPGCVVGVITRSVQNRTLSRAGAIISPLAAHRMAFCDDFDWPGQGAIQLRDCARQNSVGSHAVFQVCFAAL